MNRKTLGLIVLLLGIVLLIGGGAGAVKGFMALFNSSEPIKVFSGPGDVGVTIEKPDTYTVWHEHQTWFEGSFVSNPAALPPGTAFTLESGAHAAPFKPISGSQTISSGQRQAEGVGTFEVTHPGTYLLTAHGDASQPRIFSISKGNFLSLMGKAMGQVFLFGILAFLGIALAIGGILMVFLRRKSAPPSLAPS